MKAVNFWKTLFLAALAITTFSACSDDDKDEGGMPSITVNGEASTTVAVNLDGGTTEAVEVVSSGSWTLSLKPAADWCHPSQETGSKGKTSLTFKIDKWEGAKSTDSRQVTATLLTQGSFEGIPIPKEATIVIKQNGDGSTAVTTNVAEVRKLLEAIGKAGAVTDEVANMTLTGIVVSDAAGLNMASGKSAPYFIAVQDDSTEPGSGLTLNSSNFKDMALVPGDVVTIPLTGSEISYYNEVLQLKISNDAKITTSKTTPLSPVTITADKILDYESMLVKIENCQPTIDFIGQAWNNSGNKGNVDFEIIPGKTTTFIVRTGSAAAFKDDKVPEKSGSIVGIASRFKADAQVMPRTAADFNGLDKDYAGPEFKAGTIGQIKVGEYWEVTATVAALYSRGFLLADDTGYTLVYNADWTSQTDNTYKINQKVTVRGKVEKFPSDGGLLQFNSPEIKDAGTGSFTPGQATEFNAANLTAYESDLKYMPVTLTGVLTITKNENYNSYTVAVTGYDSRTVTIAYAFDKDFTGLVSGDVVDITGFAIGTNYDKTAINIMLKTIAKNTSTAAVVITSTPDEFVASGAEQTFNFTVSNAGSNKVFAKIEASAGDAGQFSVPTGEISGTSVKVTAAANTEVKERTAKLIVYLAAAEGGAVVASDEVTLTQAAKEPEGTKTVTFDYATITEVNSTVGDISITCQKNTGSDPVYNSNSKELRIYRYNSFTLSAAKGKIFEIEITFSSKDRMGYQISVDSGSYTDNSTAISGTWTGNAASVKFTNNGDADNNVQARITKIVVKYVE